MGKQNTTVVTCDNPKCDFVKKLDKDVYPDGVSIRLGSIKVGGKLIYFNGAWTCSTECLSEVVRLRVAQDQALQGA